MRDLILRERKYQRKKDSMYKEWCIEAGLSQLMKVNVNFSGIL